MSRPAVWRHRKPVGVLTCCIQCPFPVARQVIRTGMRIILLRLPGLFGLPIRALEGHGEVLAAFNPVSCHFRVVPVQPALEHAGAGNDRQLHIGRIVTHGHRLAGMALINVVQLGEEGSFRRLGNFHIQVQRKIARYLIFPSNSLAGRNPGAARNRRRSAAPARHPARWFVSTPAASAGPPF